MRVLRLLPLLVLLAACATAPRSLDLSNAEIIDLTYVLDENTLYWPSSPSGFELKQLAYGPTPGGYFYSSYAFSAPEHGGTHLDAPIHFAKDRRTVDEIPLEQLIAPAVVIDISSHAAANADYRLTMNDIADWEASNGRIPSGSIVLLRTGWGKHYGNRLLYFGDDKPGATDNLHFPSYGEEAARLLVAERQVAALGVDTPSIDYGQSRDFMVHQIANGANVPGLENVANLERLPARGAWVVALPMKIAGGSGGPVRIVAVVPK